MTDAREHALYFSRAPIPWARDAFADARDALPAGLPVMRHIGLYAYRAGFLRRFPALPPAPMEQLEALEQLRVLWHGERIAVLGAIAGENSPAGEAATRALLSVRGAIDAALPVPPEGR